jgi:transposase
MTIFCGIDWAEQHHDIALINTDGCLVAKRRIADNATGFAELIDMLAAAEEPEQPIAVAIETPRGLLVAALRATGRRVYAINPMAVARYRERHTMAGKKSDHLDAMVLANILRTDIQAHRPLPADSDLARAVAVLARAHQDATWRRTKASNELRSLLREYYPAFLAAFATNTANLTAADARAVLAIAPTPTAAATLSLACIASALRDGGRQRRVQQVAEDIHAALAIPQLRQPPLVERAMGQQALALLAVLNVACTNVDTLAEECADAFRTHPDHKVITSFPGLADLTGARLLAEIGDDRRRFADARALKAYAGSAPVTRASGRTRTVTHRRIKNNRLASAGFVWAFIATRHSPSAREHYQRRKDHGDRHSAALRHLFNRMLGCLHHCLHTGQTYNDAKAFARDCPENGVTPGGGTSLWGL